MLHTILSYILKFVNPEQNGYQRKFVARREKTKSPIDLHSDADNINANSKHIRIDLFHFSPPCAFIELFTDLSAIRRIQRTETFEQRPCKIKVRKSFDSFNIRYKMNSAQFYDPSSSIAVKEKKIYKRQKTVKI